jgi:hypothetical protein
MTADGRINREDYPRAFKMDETTNNTPLNQLGPGVTEEQVRNAIDKSGYPLQMYVSDLFRSKPGKKEPFAVTEEWCFVDRDTQELRNLDMLAALRLHGWKPQPRVRPQLTVLVECKQSELPFIFFETREKPHLVTFPPVVGLRSDKVQITTDDEKSSWHYTVSHALDLDQDYFQKEPIFSFNLSKCVRKGKELELSGSDAYNGLILPLVKALQHFITINQPVKTAEYFDAHLALALAVIDAPMLSVTVEPDRGTCLVANPWVRVLRHEHVDGEARFASEKLWVIDAVHKHFLNTYVDQHLLPFADRFAERVLRHPTELADSRGFVPGMGADCWTSIESRMKVFKPKTPSPTSRRRLRMRTPRS